jgi:hypothetical protein
MFLCVVIDHSGLCVGSEDLTAVFMMNIVFWNETSSESLEVKQHFGGVYCLHLENRRVSHVSKE